MEGAGFPGASVPALLAEIVQDSTTDWDPTPAFRFRRTAGAAYRRQRYSRRSWTLVFREVYCCSSSSSIFLSLGWAVVNRYAGRFSFEGLQRSTADDRANTKRATRAPKEIIAHRYANQSP